MTTKDTTRTKTKRGQRRGTEIAEVETPSPLPLFAPVENDPEPPPVPEPTAKVIRVLNLILEGRPEHEINAAVVKAFPGDDPKPLILAAMTMLREAGKDDPAVIHGFCFQATLTLYRKMYSEKNWTGALAAIRQIASLSSGRK